MTDPVPPTETPDAVSPEDEAPIQEPDVSALTVMKDAIIAEALPNIPFDGWSMEALKAGAQMAGYDREAAQTCFPKGAIDAIVHFCDLADRLMIADLHELMLEQPELRLHERIRAAIRLRLSRWGGEKEAIRRASTILAMPGNIPTSLKVTYRTIDSMWFAAGDRSMDIAFYTKRLQLTGIYTATLFYWLEDHSEESVDSWAFLDRRLADVLKIHKARQQLEDRLRRLPLPIANPLEGLMRLRDGVSGLGRMRSMRMK